METCEYGATGKPVKDCERYKTLQAGNERLKAKTKRLKRKVEIWQKKHDKLLKVLERTLKANDAD